MTCPSVLRYRLEGPYAVDSYKCDKRAGHKGVHANREHATAWTRWGGMVGA